MMPIKARAAPKILYNLPSLLGLKLLAYSLLINLVVVILVAVYQIKIYW